MNVLKKLSRLAGFTGGLALLVLLALPGTGLSAGEGVSGIWRGTMEIGDTKQQLSFTVRQRGDAFTGTIAIPTDNLNFPIEAGEYDDGYLSLSGISPVTLPDGSTPKMRFVYEGFLDDNQKEWEGDWRMEVAETKQPTAASGSFKVTRTVAGSGGGTETDPPKEPTKTTPPEKPAEKTDANEKTKGPTPPENALMAGAWSGPCKPSEAPEPGTLSIEVKTDGASFKGSGTMFKEGDDEIPVIPITFTSGKLDGKRFELAGTIAMPMEDGGEMSAIISLSGQVSGDTWRGNLLIKVEVEEEEVPVVSATFNLKRGDGASPKSDGGAAGKSELVNPIK